MSIDQNHIINHGQLPPQVVELERAVLGALLVDETAPFEVLPVIRNANVFYKDEHAKIFAAIQQLVAESNPVDVLTVSERLKKAGQLQQVGGDLYLMELSTAVASSAHTEYHTRIILQHAVMRELIGFGIRVIESGYNEQADVFEVYEKAQTELAGIGDTITQEQTRDWATILKETTFEIERLSDDQTGPRGVPTGFAKLDDLTGGWHGGQLIIMAARPGMGKTAMAVKHVCVAASQQMPVGIFELEMRDVDFAKRIIAYESNLHANQLFVHGLNQGGHDYWPGYWAAHDTVATWPVHLNTRPGLNVYDFQIEARKMVQRDGVKLIVVDYLQLMSVGRDSKTIQNREQEISFISRSLKKTALELNVPILALSQLSRSVETRSDKRPRLSDLRESGSLEQDADIVAFIYRDEYYNENSVVPGIAEYIFDKHRNGQTGTCDVGFIADRVKFCEVNELQQPTQTPY